MNFHKNELIDDVLSRFYDTFRLTLDTADFVPEKYNVKILTYIFKNMKKAFRRIDREDRVYQRRHRGDDPEQTSCVRACFPALPEQTERDGTSDQDAPHRGTP